MTKQTVEIDNRTLIRFWLILLGIGLVILFLYKALTGLIIIGVSIFLALALKPLVRKLNNFFTKHFGIDKSHKTSAAVLAYTIIVVLFVAIIAIVGPVVVNETAKFIQQLPTALNERLGGWDGINDFGKNIGIDNLQEDISKGLTTFANQLFGNLGTTIVTSVSTIADIVSKGVLILVLTLLFMLEGPSIMNAFWKSLGARKEDKKPVAVAKHVVHRMSNVISTYVSKQAFVALLDGFAAGVFVLILSLIFGISTTLSIPMGLIAFVFYLIPMFGQVISSCLIGAVLAFSNPIAAIIYIVVYIFYAQIENNVIAPKIQGDALRLPAVAILAAMVIGMYMFGLLGAIIAIPIAGCIRVLVEEYPNIKSARE